MAHLAKHLSGFGAGDLFQILRDGRPRTRSELAAQTGYARSTIASRIEELLASGLITPVSDAVSTGGRPSARIALNAQTRLVAAADFGATHATVAVMDLAGKVLAEEASLRKIDTGPDDSLVWLADTVRVLLQRVARDPNDLLAIGIGLPGPVEHATGRPTSPPIMPGWDGYDVPTRVREAFDVPVLVDNDVNVMAFGERSTGWPQVQNLMFVKVATGIGAGIISGGILQRGENGSAGDIGHIAIPGGEAVLCRCGNRGCLEAVAGVPAIVARLAVEGIDVSTADELVALGRTGHLRVMQMIREAGRDIGQVLSACVSIVNPSLIVVGGSMSKSNELLLAGMREVVYSRSTPLATQNLTIAPSRVGAEAGVIGAGTMAIEHALSPEVINPADETIRRSRPARDGEVLGR
jgi:predicted NBD/HSP70 family sugar kinase